MSGSSRYAVLAAAVLIAGCGSVDAAPAPSPTPTEQPVLHMDCVKHGQLYCRAVLCQGTRCVLVTPPPASPEEVRRPS